jgi:FMN reductase [NAD(P)H]
MSVITNADLRQRINDTTQDALINSGIEFLQQRASLPGYQPLYGAPVAILLSGPADQPSAPINAALSAGYMLLQATDLGLASCFLRSPTFALCEGKNVDLQREAGIPEGYNLQCAVVVGYGQAENKFTLGERNAKGTINYAN